MSSSILSSPVSDHLVETLQTQSQDESADEAHKLKEGEGEEHD